MSPGLKKFYLLPNQTKPSQRSECDLKGFHRRSWNHNMTMWLCHFFPFSVDAVWVCFSWRISLVILTCSHPLSHLTHQSLCLEVRARRRGVSSVLKLCQKLLQQSQVGNKKLDFIMSQLTPVTPEKKNLNWQQQKMEQANCPANRNTFLFWLFPFLIHFQEKNTKHLPIAGSKMWKLARFLSLMCFYLESQWQILMDQLNLERGIKMLLILKIMNLIIWLAL